MKIIIYESKTGFTDRYAQMLAAKTGFKVFPLNKAKKQVSSDDEVIFLGWIFAGMIQGLKKARTKFNITVIAGVGMSPYSDKYFSDLKSNNQIGEIPFFFLRGGVTPSKLNFIKKGMLNMVANMTEKEALVADTEEEKEQGLAMVKMLKEGGDFVDETLLEPLYKTIC